MPVIALAILTQNTETQQICFVVELDRRVVRNSAQMETLQPVGIPWSIKHNPRLFFVNVTYQYLVSIFTRNIKKEDAITYLKNIKNGYVKTRNETVINYRSKIDIEVAYDAKH